MGADQRKKIPQTVINTFLHSAYLACSAALCGPEQQL